jgi:uncharacterized protein YaaW (UPF0174 family)
MTFRDDPDLMFYKDLKNEDLDPLVQIISKSKSQKNRITEKLTSTEEFKKHNPDHHKYWQLVAGEFQRFGANTIMTKFRRGKGVLYSEILVDVSTRLKVNFNKNSPIDAIEINLLMKILTDSIEKLSDMDLKVIVNELNLNTNILTKSAVIAALQTAILRGGFLPYKMAMIVSNSVAKLFLGRGLTFAANAAINKSIAIFTGPVGWVITGLWAIMDVASPAYRVTIPATIFTAYLRLKNQNENM